MNSRPIHRLNPGPAEAHRCLLHARVFESLLCPRRAEIEYLSALDRNPAHAEAVLDAAERFLASGDNRRAERIALAVTRRPGCRPRAFAVVASALRAQRRDAAALSALRRAVELEPEAPQLARELSELLGDQRRFAEAHEILARLLDRDPLDPFNHGYLGEVLRQQGKTREAIEAFRTALWLSPAYTWAARQLAGVFCELKRPDDARGVLRQALSAEPGDSGLQRCLEIVASRSRTSVRGCPSNSSRARIS